MKQSAGLLVYNYSGQDELQVLLAHPGGPFYAKKDAGVWSIPKGEYQSGEEPLQVAIREFEEETGNKIYGAEFIPLGSTKLKSGKEVVAWAVQQHFDPCFISSNTFEMEWPPRTGKMQSFPEVDRASWFTIAEAQIQLHPAQTVFLERLQEHLKQAM